MPDAFFFFKPLKGSLGDEFVTLSEYFGNFNDKEKWIRFSMIPSVSTFSIFKTAGSVVELLDEHTWFKMPRLVALYNRLMDNAIYNWWLTANILLLAPFFTVNDYDSGRKRIQGVCAWLSSFASSTCLTAGTGVLNLHVLFNLPSAAISLLFLYPGQYLFVLILAALTVVEFTTYAFPVVILAYVWIKIYGQLLKAFCPNFELQWLRKTSPSLEEVCQAASSADVQYRNLHAELNAAITRPELPANLRLSSFALLQQPWHALRHSDDAHLVLSSRYFAWLASEKAGTRTLVGVQRSLLLPALRALIPLLEDELSRRGSSPDIEPRTFDHAIHELAGIFIKHLLPLPQIKHLKRPFRLRAVLPFFLPYPLVRPVPTRAITFDPQTEREALKGACGRLAGTTVTYPKYMSNAGLKADESAHIFSLILRGFEAQEEAVKAEDKAHEAVLETVLLWKERKNELERKRFKRE